MSARGADGRGARGRRRREQLTTLAGQAGVFLLILGLWQWVSVAKLIKPVLASSPAEVWDFLIEIGRSGELWVNLRATLEATVLAFVLGSVTGVVLGLSLAVMPRLERAIDPLLNALNGMPRIALGPLFVLYFGFGLAAKVALGFSLVVFILMVNARAGALSVDPDLIRLSRALNASRLQMFTKIMLPSSIPAIFAGLRLGIIYALLGVITAEIIASQTGMGARILYYSNVFQIKGVYGILIILAIVAAVLNTLMAWAERRLLRWRPALES